MLKPENIVCERRVQHHFASCMWDCSTNTLTCDG